MRLFFHPLYVYKPRHWTPSWWSIQAYLEVAAVVSFGKLDGRQSYLPKKVKKISLIAQYQGVSFA